MRYLQRCNGWNEVYNLGYRANQTGLLIQAMTPRQQTTAFKGLLLQISIISGCPIPSDANYLQLLENETIRFLTEHNKFKNLTVEEILTAFRFNAAGKFDEKIKHWQNMFNLDYMGEVLLKWLPIKNKIESKVKKELFFKNLNDEDMQDVPENELLDYCKAEWLRTNDFMFIHRRAFTILYDGKKIVITEEGRERVSARAEHITSQIYRLYWAELAQVPRKDIQTVVCHKIAVAEYFNGGPLLLYEAQSVPGHEQIDNPYAKGF